MEFLSEFFTYVEAGDFVFFCKTQLESFLKTLVKIGMHFISLSKKL